MAQTLPGDGLGTAGPPASEEIYYLDPFSVSAGENSNSYEAKDTLAANRIRTDLKDVGSAISVITTQFLHDTGARNSQDLLVYTPSTEVGGTRGNFAGLGDRDNPTDQAARLAPQNNTRIRGLAAADNTRDFFLTDIPWDSFNVGRIDIQRGPNAILFGLGSPAGIINASTNGASFKNEGAVELRFGRFGSHRTTFDLNRVLLKDELAVRLDLLDDRTEFEQRPAYNHDRRWYGAVRWDPKFLRRGSARTSLKLNFEQGEIDANRPHILPPNDLITPWFTAVNKAGVSPLAFRPDGFQVLTQGAPFFAGFDHPTTNESVLRSDHGYPFFSGNNLAQVRRPGDFVARSGAPSDIFNVYRSSVLVDPSIFDYLHLLPEGPNKREWSRHDVANLTVSQTLLDNRLGIELALDRQHQRRAATSGADGAAITIDVNSQLPDGSVNPNFGRPFIATTGDNGDAFSSTRQAARVTAFGELRFRDILGESRLTRFLGRHIFTAFWSRERADTEEYHTFGAVADESLVPILDGDTYFADRRIGLLNYLGPSLSSRSSAAGANLPALPVFHRPQSGIMRVAGPNGWVDLPLTLATNPDVSRSLADRSFLSRDDIVTGGLAWQAYLFDGLLVPMAGVRHDRDQSYALANVPRHADGSVDFSSPDYVIPARPRGVVTGNSTSWSVVAHSPQFLRQRLPGDTDVSFFYSRSENFQPKSGRIDPFGAPLPPPLGKTRDYGVQLSLLGGRLSAKINWYDTTVANDTLPEFGSFYWLSATEAWGYGFARQALANGGNGTLTFAGGYTPAVGQTGAESKADGIAIASTYLDPANQPSDSFYQLYGIDRSQWAGNIFFIDPARLGVTVTGSTRSQGTEFEFIAQPVPNWNIMFNFSMTKAQNHGLADSLAAWIEQRWAVFNTPVPGTSRPAVIGDLRMWWNDPNTQTVRQAFHDNIWIPYRLYRAKENTDVPELRPRRFNLVTDYTFRTGRLEGTKIGGACRWQDRVVLGYPVLPDAIESSAQPFDLSHPYLGSNEMTVDLWIGYERKLSPKIHWRCQLNVTNVFAKSGLIPISVQPDGSMAAGRIAEPRTWTVTNVISF